MINIRETEDQKVRITSDPHLGHNPKWNVPIWQARGYSCVKEMDDAIIDNYNAMCRPNDILIMLGDLCLNCTMDQLNAYLDRIQCRNIWCLWGNHNNPHEKSVFRKAMGQNYIGPFQVETYPFQYKNMLYVGDRLKATLNGQFTIMDHYPIYVWEEMQHGAWMLCGHSHYGCELSRAETMTGKILDVGWDGHKSVWTLEEIRAVMDKKQIAVVDHHRPDAPRLPVVAEKG